MSQQEQDPTYQARINIENALETLVDNGWALDEIEAFLESKMDELRGELEEVEVDLG